jgi:hypothetical protein
MPKSNKLLPRYILDIASRLANLSPALGPFSYGNKNVYVLAALSIKRRADKNNKKKRGARQAGNTLDHTTSAYVRRKLRQTIHFILLSLPSIYACSLTQPNRINNNETTRRTQ